SHPGDLLPRGRDLSLRSPPPRRGRLHEPPRATLHPARGGARPCAAASGGSPPPRHPPLLGGAPARAGGPGEGPAAPFAVPQAPAREGGSLLHHGLVAGLRRRA